MKPFLILLCLFNFSLSSIAQTDTTNTRKKTWVKPLILPTSLIIAGTSLHFSTKAKQSITEWAPLTETQVDDYIQYTPIAIMYGADIFYRTKNHPLVQTGNLLLSELTTGLIVHSLKWTINEKRPNGANGSFPSGHTSQAFVAATVLYHEFKETNKFIAYSGYAFAIPTAILRVTRRKHWVSDILAGAGIGILCTNLVYLWNPFEKLNNKLQKRSITVVPFSDDRASGITTTLRF